MRYFSFYIFAGMLCFAAPAFSQSTMDNDSIVNVICIDLNKDKKGTGEERINRVVPKHFERYAERFQADSIEAVKSNIFLRLQKLCPEFSKIITAMTSQYGDWEVVDTEPVSVAKEEDCNSLFIRKQIKYLEPSGDTVNVLLNGSTWEEHFKDGTYSKLSVTHVSPCEFVLKFIESNNEVRRNFSKPGDEYRYITIEKTREYYKMFAGNKGADRKFLFRIY